MNAEYTTTECFPANAAPGASGRRRSHAGMLEIQ